MVERAIRRRVALTPSADSAMSQTAAWLIPLVTLLVVATGWAYWSTAVDMFKEWQRDDDYSAGQLVPLVAIFFLWVDRKKLACLPLKPCWLGGLALLVLAQAARAYGVLFLFESAERYSLVLAVAALVLMVAGTAVFWRVKWILLFLFLMVPLPGRIHNMISGPLQGFASTGSVFVLEAFGVRVSQQGNVVTLDQRIPMGVAEACSGLRMLTAFIIVAVFVAYMVKRPRWQKVVLVISSIPVAVLCNILRIVATAVLFLHASSEVAEKFFHDFAGLVMMPAAVMLMFGQLWIMAMLTVPEDKPPQKAVVIGRRKPRGQ
ncbi:MAG: exosortase/archaeosortase family protein [Planctomycetota bacterium]|nr:exosortase/archaeosortase family protein [Planctomycetota bacterium]